MMTRPSFVQCTVASIPVATLRTLSGGVHINNPVNLSFCRAIRRGDRSWYVDDSTKTPDYPTIFFEGLETHWMFRNEAQRDEEFDRLMGAYGDQGESTQ